MQSIGDVLKELDRIIDREVKENRPHAVFAFVYRRTTAKIAEGLQENRFQDNARMETFDVAFAQRYIDAYWQQAQGEKPTRSWQLAFGQEGQELTLIQHLLLGMNAHINLDLGIVAAEMAPKGEIAHLKSDFMLVNDLLQELIEEMQGRLSKVSRLMFLLDWAGGRSDESVVNFSMRRARDFAWVTACTLAALEPADRLELILKVDEQIAGLAGKIARPKSIWLRTLLGVVRFFEIKDVDRVIRLLRK